MEASWTDSAKQANAAAIFIVNDVDDEEVPPLPPGFRYLETGYRYPLGLSKPDEAFLVGCECKKGKSKTCEWESCECQEAEGDDDVPAYLENLYNFEYAGGVNECNQVPRRFPVQVFKTAGCGWGVCSTVAIERGTVLGIFTGEILRRKNVKRAASAAQGYLFDLDGHEQGGGLESDDDDDSDPRYSVNAYACGNWTRFINHSCDPNTCVYSVTYDTPSEANQPYHAFVATRVIHPHTEFTLNYRGASKATPKGKGSVKRPPGAEDCHCTSKLCLGWR
ncbi:hypothetical protein HWV62_1639 [Athelia sp. TMB]|nr:hypothetical protein HWV62_1639 [Athelia sp. TMB]